LVPCDETRAEAEPTVMVWMTEPSEALSSLTVRHRRRSVWCALHYSGEAFRQDLFHCGPHRSVDAATASARGRGNQE
jgi:hypothetical protein